MGKVALFAVIAVRLTCVPTCSSSRAEDAFSVASAAASRKVSHVFDKCVSYRVKIPFRSVTFLSRV